MIFVCYPGCTTCQKAKKWLEEQGCEFEDRNIKEQNPSEGELRAWYIRSGLPLKKFFNTSGLLYKKLGLKDRLLNGYIFIWKIGSCFPGLVSLTKVL